MTICKYATQFGRNIGCHLLISIIAPDMIQILALKNIAEKPIEHAVAD